MALLTSQGAYITQAILDIFSLLGVSTWPASNDDLPMYEDWISVSGITIDLNGVSVSHPKNFIRRDKHNLPALVINPYFEPEINRDGTYGSVLRPAHIFTMDIYLVDKRQQYSATRGTIGSMPELAILDLCGAIRAKIDHPDNYKGVSGTTTFVTDSMAPTLENELEGYFLDSDMDYIAACFRIKVGIVEDLTNP